MANKESLTHLKAARKALEEERAKILSQLAPLHARRDALIAQMQPMEKELREVQAQIKSVEQPKLREIGNQIAAIVRAFPNTRSVKTTEE